MVVLRPDAGDLADDVRAPREEAQSSTIGLLLADLTNPFFARLADRVVAEARARELQILLMTTQEDPHLEAQALETLLDRSVGGMIGTPTGHNIERWEKLAALDIPVVFVDRATGSHDTSRASSRPPRCPRGGGVPAVRVA
ncbi:hypothetical protein OG604_03070 [Streptomyces sp. NBC_01231]|nr:hypothetical protein OG604_03070 [Streptomyces sp. NBC_01231]